MTTPRRHDPAVSTSTAPPDCSCGCNGTGEVVDRDDVIAYMESGLTDDDRDAMDASLDVQAVGDAAGALDHYRRSLHVPGLSHELMLETLAQHTDHAISLQHK
jgi:hypothetical protein